MDKLLRYNGVQEALKFLREDDERTLQEHLEMCQVPAPSYEEREKAEYVRKKMVDAGISGNSKKNIEKQSPPGRSGGKADHLWAKGPRI